MRYLSLSHPPHTSPTILYNTIHYETAAIRKNDRRFVYIYDFFLFLCVCRKYIISYYK